MKQHAAVQYAIFAAMGIGFLALTVWLVRSEGQRTRQTMHEAAAEAAAEVREGMLDAGQRTVDRAAEVPREVIRDVRDEMGRRGEETVDRTVDKAADTMGKLAGEVLGNRDEPGGGEEQPAELPARREPSSQAAAANAGEDANAMPHRSNETNDAAEVPQADDSAEAATGSDIPADSVPPADPEAIDPASLPPDQEPSGARSKANAAPQEKSAEMRSGTNASERQAPSPRAVDTKEPAAQRPVARRSSARTRSKEKRKDNDAGDADDAIGRLFDLGHDMAKAVDDIGQEAFELSSDEEVEVGRDVHRLVCDAHKIVDAPAAKRRLEALALPLLLGRERKEIKYRLFVIDDDELNAFAHVGGYIYVTTGLLDFVRSDDELRFVLAHEIGHVDLRHCTRNVTYAARASELGGDAARILAQLGYIAIARGYSEENEFEADEYGLRATMRVGGKPAAAWSILARLDAHQKDNQEEGGEPKSEAESNPTIREIENHFRSHPPAPERIARLRTVAAEIK